MRIGMKKTVTQDHLGENLDELLRDLVLVNCGARQSFDIGDFDALDQFHREHAARCEFVVDFAELRRQEREAKLRLMVSQLRASLTKSSSIGMYFRSSRAITRKSKSRSSRASSRRGEHQVAQVGADDPLDPRILHLNGAPPAVSQCALDAPAREKPPQAETGRTARR